MDDLDRSRENSDVDALLADVRQLLGEEPEQPKPEAEPQPKQEEEPQPEAEPQPQPEPEEEAQPEAELSWTQQEELTEKPEPKTKKTAPEPLFNDYPELYQQLRAEKKPLTFYEQSKADYQIARRAEYEREKELDQRRRERERQRRQRGQADHLPGKDEDFSEWLYRQGQQEEGVPETPVKRRKKAGAGIVLLRVVAVLLVLALGAGCGIHFFYAECPKSETVYGTRREDVANILLVGTDQGGYRTDTVMLLHFDREKKTSSLVSIPRDTLIYCEYSVPKLNSAYGWAKGGEKGIRELLKRVTEIVGFQPDGYVVIDLEAFRELVDLMGGVRFNVPMEMHYEDPTQQLSIHLPAGERRLSGSEAMQLVRFRSGYPDADLGRTGVQRAFVVSALTQWMTPKNLIHAPSAWKLLREHTKTNLTLAQLTWLAESALLCDCKNMTTALLPGTAKYIAGGSYYVLDPAGVARLVNECLNPCEEEVSTRELSVRVG